MPAFTYITLPNDHTVGHHARAGARRDAMIAENDLALGETVDLISHSPIWEKSLILVIEDDSQDGADHVDAHRIPAFAISPYAKRGAVVHTRYDFLSFIRTLELVIGMKPLNLFDATAVPMYDAFDADPSDNDEPYDAIVPNVDLLERNTASRAERRALGAAAARVHRPHAAARSSTGSSGSTVHGADSEPPPPGPNAVGHRRALAGAAPAPSPTRRRSRRPAPAGDSAKKRSNRLPRSERQRSECGSTRRKVGDRHRLGPRHRPRDCRVARRAGRAGPDQRPRR